MRGWKLSKVNGVGAQLGVRMGAKFREGRGAKLGEEIGAQLDMKRWELS